MNFFPHNTGAVKKFFFPAHGRPLKRSKRLRHKARHRHRHIDAASLRLVRHVVKRVHNLLRQMDDPRDILVRFGRQPHHKIELYICITAGKRRFAGTQDLLLRDVFIDYIPQALRPRLRREGQR